MYYLIQSNIYSDPEHHKVFDVLEELGYAYEAYELKPGTETITPGTGRKDIFVYGSVKLARLARAHTDWYPGSFYGGNHQFEVHAPYYQTHLLNYTAQVFRFAEAINWEPGETKFIKPYQDAKAFTGKVFTQTKWSDFVQDSLLNPRTPLLHADTLVQASVPQTLTKEARVWIVGGMIVASTYYRYHGDVPFEQQLPPDAVEFVKEMIGLFTVADAYVMDIGHTPAGWKIVEINSISSAGFYHLDSRPLFRALEIYFS
jgi:ATP-grasp domain, R2K clade family 3